MYWNWKKVDPFDKKKNILKRKRFNLGVLYRKCIEIGKKWILLKKREKNHFKKKEFDLAISVQEVYWNWKKVYSFEKKEIILRKEEIYLRYCTRGVLKLEESRFFWKKKKRIILKRKKFDLDILVYKESF